MAGTQDLFAIECLIKNINVKLSACTGNGVKQLIALVTSDGEVVLYYAVGDIPSSVSRIAWFNNKNKEIQAIAFDPSNTWLLVVSLDGSLYIIPALGLVDKRPIDCKWSLNDLTHFPKNPQTPSSSPTAVIWWETRDGNQNAFVGFEDGSVVLISLTDGRWLGSCSITEAVTELQITWKPTLHKTDSTALIIAGKSGQQWRLIIEEHSKGYVWPPDIKTQTDDSTRNRLNNLKQLGTEKLASLKQKWFESKSNRRDSQTSDTISEASSQSHTESTSSEPELLPHFCDTYFAARVFYRTCLFTAFYKPASILTLYDNNFESRISQAFKLPPNVSELLVTQCLFYVINGDRNLISIVSTRYSEISLEGESEFNEEALIAKFPLNETIKHVYIMSDKYRNKRGKSKDNSNKLKEKPEEVCSFDTPQIDACVIVTENSVYKIVSSTPPNVNCVNLLVDDNNMEKAEKICQIFGLNSSLIMEGAGDILIHKGSYHAGIILYKQAKVHLLKRVLKLATRADCSCLLKFVNACLSASKVDMSVATKIHMGNLGIMAYTELILRYRGNTRISNTKDFMNFLSHQEFYDQILAVNIAFQAGHWNIVTLLAKFRGVQPEVVAAFGQVLKSALAPRSSDKEFLFALSESSLTQSLLISPENSRIIFEYIRMNLSVFPVDILQRFAVQLDPSQPCAIPLVSRLFQKSKRSSSLDTTFDSVDADIVDRAVVVAKDLIETFLFVVIYLTWKTDNTGFDLDLLNSVDLPENADIPSTRLQKLPDLHTLSCGYEHTAVIRNNNVYTMGMTSSGCLGLGPSLTQSSPAKLVETLSELKVKVLSVSCGRKHTLALTDFGLYSWGSNSYGQLGLGKFIQETPYPVTVSALACEKLVDVAAGQYHSMALTSSGLVYTWGWGIHGQLGHGTSADEFLPKCLRFSHAVKQVTAGYAHSLVLTVDGKLYGFGSNAFGQLESAQMDGTKTSRPVWVLLMPDMYVPIEKVATVYFHNIAIRTDQVVCTWGASPHELRYMQWKAARKQDIRIKPGETLKACTQVYATNDKKPIDQVAVGYRHFAILDKGKIFWGRNRNDELNSPRLREQDNLNSMMSQRFLHVSCGLDYTMAIDHMGKLLAWGSNILAEALSGKPVNENLRKTDATVIISKSTKRVLKLPNTLQGPPDTLPVEVPGLPKMAITFNPSDHRLLFSKQYIPYAVRRIENSLKEIQSHVDHKTFFDHIYECPKLKFGPKTLHYALQSYVGCYDTENILQKCLEVQNYQAASKVVMLDGHYVDSLGFQLTAFKKHLEVIDVDVQSVFSNKLIDDDVDLTIKTMQEDLNEKNLQHSVSVEKISCGSPAHILSSSSSLDSIRHWGDDLEHQGGCESTFEVSGDVRQNITQYVQSLQSDNSPPIYTISKMVSDAARQQFDEPKEEQEEEIKDNRVKLIVDEASQIVEFYTTKIYLTENHILMQNVLMKCIEFWLGNNLPVTVLEKVLLKNLDKYFYPLAILLFCKNFGSNSDEDILKDDCKLEKRSSGFLKEFSTKFCLQLCSIVLESVNKS